MGSSYASSSLLFTSTPKQFTSSALAFSSEGASSALIASTLSTPSVTKSTDGSRSTTRGYSTTTLHTLSTNPSGSASSSTFTESAHSSNVRTFRTQTSVSESFTSKGPGSTSLPTSNLRTSSLASATPGAGSSSSTSSLRSSTNSGASQSGSGITSATPVILTSIVVESSTTLAVPIISGESGSTPITLPVVTATITGTQVEASVSSASSEIAALFPLLSSWKASPTPLKSEASDNVQKVLVNVEDLISDFGGKSSSSGCNSKKKRSLLSDLAHDVEDITNTLVCAAENLDKIKGKVEAGNVDDVESLLENLKSENEQLEAEEKQYEKDEDESSSQSSSGSSTGSSTSSSTSSTASCTSTETALRVTVVCKPTSITTGSSTVPTTTCSPSTTVTTKGCSVTGLTTTITASTSSTASASKVCALGSCAGELCSTRIGPLSGAPMATLTNYNEDCASMKTTTITGTPTNGYEAVMNTVATAPTGLSKRNLLNQPLTHNETQGTDILSKRVLQEPTVEWFDTLNDLIQAMNSWVSQAVAVTAQWYNFEDTKATTAGVTGLYGCTSVIITSSLGVYISHIFEDPVFIQKNSDGIYEYTSDAYFETMAIGTLFNGGSHATSIDTLIGTVDQPGVLNSIYGPSVHVVTPYSQTSNEGGFKYGARAERLRSAILSLFPTSPQNEGLLGYIIDTEQSLNPVGLAGRAVVEHDPYQETMVTPLVGGTHALVTTVGAWRLWVAGIAMVHGQGITAQSTVSLSSLSKRRSGSGACAIISNSSVTSSSRSSSPGSSTTATGGSTRASSSLETTVASISASGNASTLASESTTASSAISKSFTTTTTPTVTKCSIAVASVTETFVETSTTAYKSITDTFCSCGSWQYDLTTSTVGPTVMAGCGATWTPLTTITVLPTTTSTTTSTTKTSTTSTTTTQSSTTSSAATPTGTVEIKQDGKHCYLSATNLGAPGLSTCNGDSSTKIANYDSKTKSCKPKNNVKGESDAKSDMCDGSVYWSDWSYWAEYSDDRSLVNVFPGDMWCFLKSMAPGTTCEDWFIPE